MQLLETLKKKQLLENIKKCEYLVYLGYMISGGELNIDPDIMDAIMRWLMPTNVFEVRCYIVATQYPRKFITSFFSSSTTTPHHKSKWREFLARRVLMKASQKLKKNISQAPILTLLNLQQCFEVYIDVSGYATRACLMGEKGPYATILKYFMGKFSTIPLVVTFFFFPDTFKSYKKIEICQNLPLSFNLILALANVFL